MRWKQAGLLLFNLLNETCDKQHIQGVVFSVENLPLQRAVLWKSLHKMKVMVIPENEHQSPSALRDNAEEQTLFHLSFFSP